MANSKKSNHPDNTFFTQDSGPISSFRIPQVPKSIEFKVNCFSPSNSPQKTLSPTLPATKPCLPSSNLPQRQLPDIVEDSEDDGVSGLNQNVYSEIMNKNFFNKTIMDFNKCKNRNKSVVFTEPAVYSMPDVNSHYHANSENFFDIEEKFELNRLDFIEKEALKDKKPTIGPFHPSFKLDFSQKLPPTNEKAGLSSRLPGGSLEEDVQMLRKLREEYNRKRKDKKKNVRGGSHSDTTDTQIFQLHENFEKNLELFKREEDEFLRKIKKINLLEHEEEESRERSKLEKEFEQSLLHIVIEERALSKEYDTKKTVKEGGSVKVLDSKLSNLTIDSKKSYVSAACKSITRKKDQPRFEDLMKAILDSDMPRIDAILEEIPISELNRVDCDGNSPLFLAVKMAHKNEDFQNVIKNILNAGGNPKIKDSRGWTPLDESITQTNVKVTLYLFDTLCRNKRLQIEREKDRLLAVLGEIPDFYLEMKWDFESSIIPLVSHIAPSDTFRIWKYGKSIRVDYNLVGVKNLKAKKRDVSIVFNPEGHVLERPDVREFNSEETGNGMWLLNHSHKNFTNPLQEIDIHEKKMILYDLLTSQPIEGNMNILDCVCRESKNWLGNKILQRINTWKSKRFDLAISYEYKINKKEHITINGLEDYMKAVGKKDHEHPTENSVEVKNEAPELKNDKNFIERLERMNFNVPIDKRKKVKKTNMMLWISEEFPMKFKDFLPMLTFLSKGNVALDRLSVVLNNEEIQRILNSNGFPVKIQIPFSFSIVANVFFETFNDLKYCDRKEAQKIMSRPKKRILLANLLI